MPTAQALLAEVAAVLQTCVEAGSTSVIRQPGVLAAWAGMSPAVRVNAAAAAGSAERQGKPARRGRERAGMMVSCSRPWGAFC
jgi:hypothetical protein